MVADGDGSNIIPDKEGKMSDEANYKATLALEAVEKIREEVHAMRVDLSVMQQKSSDHHQFMTDRIKSLSDSIERMQGKVDGLTQENIQRKGFMDAIKTIFLRHPIIAQLFLFGLLILISPNFIKSHFLG